MVLHKYQMSITRVSCKKWTEWTHLGLVAACCAGGLGCS
jgi:hypothetical protein